MRLPIIDPKEKFSCGTCSQCCQQPWTIAMEKEKAAALKDADFSAYPQLQGTDFFQSSDGAPEGYLVLAKQPDSTRCIFLDSDGLCIIHKELGAEAKPWSCQRFPYHDSPTFVDHRISVSFGCPSVIKGTGQALVEQQDEIESQTRVGKAATNADAFVALDAETGVAHDDYDRLADALECLFLPNQDSTIWQAFAASLNLVAETIRRKRADDSELGDWLQTEAATQFAAQQTDVVPFAAATSAPSQVRLRFAATLLRDAMPPNMSFNASLWRRILSLPRLMPLAKLTGQYDSKYQQRRIDIDRVIAHPLPEGIDREATEVLKRCFRARIWQRFLIGTRLSVTAGLHQHIHDLNAILFWSRADACYNDEPRLTADVVGDNLSRFEFHFANQVRMFRHNSLGWFTSQLNDINLARLSLRLFAMPASHTAAAPLVAPLDVPSTPSAPLGNMPLG